MWNLTSQYYIVLNQSSSTSGGRDAFSYTPKDIYAMEQLILLLRRETADFKVALKERDDTIIAMRKDLQGALVKH